MLNFKFWLCIAILYASSQLAAQTGSDPADAENIPVPEILPPSEIYSAQFPGGSAALQQYLTDSLRFPECEWEHGMSGTVRVAFDVNVNGSVENVRALNVISGAPGFATEAIRLVQAMPPWTPATLMARKVKTSQSLNVVFTYTGNGTIASPDSCPCGPCDPAADTTLQMHPDVAPKFATGDAMLQVIIKSRIHYPDSAIINKKQGTVTVRRLVEKNGTVSKAYSVQGVDDAPELDREAERIALTLTGFNPAIKGGVACRAWTDIQIKFVLPK